MLKSLVMTSLNHNRLISILNMYFKTITPLIIIIYNNRCIVSVEEDCLDIDVPALNICDRSTNLWKPNNRGFSHQQDNSNNLIRVMYRNIYFSTGNSDFLIYGGLELRCVDENMSFQIEHIFSKVL